MREGERREGAECGIGGGLVLQGVRAKAFALVLRLPTQFTSNSQNTQRNRWKSGGCRFGERCNFAHGPNELRAMTRREGGEEDDGSAGGGGLPIGTERLLVRFFFYFFFFDIIDFALVIRPSRTLLMPVIPRTTSAFDVLHAPGAKAKQKSRGIGLARAPIRAKGPPPMFRFFTRLFRGLRLEERPARDLSFFFSRLLMEGLP